MSKNIKETGKELMGKSLNSFHRKTGLTQLEKNNEMQDGILNGILSQVDDAYIEKTEQSNVIHLDGSGDGVVVLDSIEGNTMVNLIKPNYSNMSLHSGNSKENNMVVLNGNGTWQRKLIGYNHVLPIKPDTNYTVVVDIISNTLSSTSMILLNSFTGNLSKTLTSGTVGKQIFRGTTISELSMAQGRYFLVVEPTDSSTEGSMKVKVMIFEGHIDDDKIPPHIFGLQSSFEENKEEDKYKIEILSNNKNLLNIGKIEENIGATSHPAKITVKNNKVELNNSDDTYWIRGFYKVKVKPNTKYIFTSIVTKGMVVIYKGSHLSNNFSWNTNYIYSYLNYTNQENRECVMKFTTDSDEEYIYIRFSNEGVSGVSVFESPMVEKNENKTEYNPHKQNKIKLLINEPLRGINNTKDRLCIKDNKLMVERNIYGFTHTPTKTTIENINTQLINDGKYRCKPNNTWNTISGHLICDKNNEIQEYNLCANTPNTIYIEHKAANNPYLICINSSDLSDRKICYILETPYYEEVLNEYGEPILLEGYENGIIYINSTIVPTTTVRYTPKMESFKTLKEVENNNIMLTNDVNDNIIPYMMDVDLMIMEKEMALMSHKNIGKMEVLDMTSMQKRTQDMLERLIKGKTLTEQECKTRVTTYLNAGKITDTQAEELMLLIDEVYA